MARWRVGRGPGAMVLLGLLVGGLVLGCGDAATPAAKDKTVVLVTYSGYAFPLPRPKPSPSGPGGRSRWSTGVTPERS